MRAVECAHLKAGGGKARDRDAVRRTTDVVESGGIEEPDRLGVATVLAAQYAEAGAASVPPCPISGWRSKQWG